MSPQGEHAVELFVAIETDVTIDPSHSVDRSCWERENKTARGGGWTGKPQCVTLLTLGPHVLVGTLPLQAYPTPLQATPTTFFFSPTWWRPI